MDLLVLGLGNPGSAYRDNRHNAGFRAVEQVAGRIGSDFGRPWFRNWLWVRQGRPGQRLVLVKALTFMNLSGTVLEAVFSATGLDRDRLLVVCDSLDLPAGRLRLKPKGGSAGHNGLKSIIACLGSDEFMRLFIGIGRPAGEQPIVDWVLGNPGQAEATVLEAACEQAAEAILALSVRPIESVMNEINTKSV